MKRSSKQARNLSIRTDYTSHKNGAFSTMKDAFDMCLSDTTLTAFEKDGGFAAMIAEAIANGQNHAFSSFMFVLALYPVLLVAL